MSSLATPVRVKMEQSAAHLRHPDLARIDGQVINVKSLGDAVARCVERLRAGLGFTLFTLNLDHLVRLRGDARFRAAYGRATFVTADGAPVVRLARRRDPGIERATGADLVAPLCAAAARERLPIYLFGATRETLARAAAALAERYPDLVIAGMDAPPFGFDPAGADAAAAGERIARSGAKLCFVALGAPKQEMFADRMMERHGGVGWLGVGAALDFLARERMRAPDLVQRLGMEWFWRLAQEPRRLGARYARCAALLARLMWMEARGMKDETR